MTYKKPCFRTFTIPKLIRQATPKVVEYEPQRRPEKTRTRPVTSVRHETFIPTRFGLLPDNREDITAKSVRCILCGNGGGTLIATHDGYRHLSCKRGKKVR